MLALDSLMPKKYKNITNWWQKLELKISNYKNHKVKEKKVIGQTENSILLPMTKIVARPVTHSHSRFK